MDLLIEKFYNLFRIEFINDDNIFIDDKLTDFGSLLFFCFCLSFLNEGFNAVKEGLKNYEKK